MSNECFMHQKACINCGGGGGEDVEKHWVYQLPFFTSISVHSTLECFLDLQCTYTFYFSFLFYISSFAFMHFSLLPFGLFPVLFGPD